MFELFCKVIGDFVLIYCWRKNGEIILGRKINMFCIEKVVKVDDGNYICEVYNYLNVELLIFFYIVIYLFLVLVY